MKQTNNFTRWTMAMLAVLVLTVAFGAQSARAQYRGVIPFVDCVEREFSGGAATGNYIAYFGYTSDESAPVLYFPGGANNYFYPDDHARPQVSTFYLGTHPRVVSIVVPIGTEETWYVGAGDATASFQASKFCGSDGTNSRLITYQGKLSDGAAAANGAYDLQFQLFNQATGGTARTAKITLDDVPVTNGVFTVQLDFSANLFPLNPAILDAENSFFEISVRAGNSIGGFTVLTPRQPLTAVPLAMRANTANNAFRAANADNAGQAGYAVNAGDAAKLGGTAADQFVKTNDSRLTDTRTPTSGSANYIQNTTAQQSNSNFNISGNGIIGGNLTVGGTISGTVSNAANADKLGNIAANQYLTTANANSNLIRNTTTQQANTNFNISGNGTVGNTLTANTITADSANNQLLNANSSSPYGTWLTLNNTTTGGRQWSIISTGDGNGEGAGKLLFYDLTNTTARLLLSDAGATVTGNLTVSGTINGTVSNAVNATNATNVSGGFVQLPLTSGAPPASECNAASQYGRQKVDATNFKLYICTSAGWKSTTLQ